MGHYVRSANLVPANAERFLDILRQDANHLLSVVVSSGVGLWSLDLVSGRWTLSDEARAMLGLSVSDEPDGLGDALLGLDRANGVFRVSRVDTGEDTWVVSTSRPVLDAERRPIRVVGSLQDVSALHRSQIELDNNESRLNAALTVGRMVIWDLDVASGIVSRSANAADVLGFCREPIGNFFARVHSADRSKVDWETSDNPVPPEGDIRFRYCHPAGREMWLESSAVRVALKGEGGHIIGITTDVTERHQAEERLRHAAQHDPLTGLLNRQAWTVLVDHLISDQARASYFLIIFDLDLFKAINDGFGHAAGDAVLLAIGERLRAGQETISAARLGGDEFAVLMSGRGDDGDAAKTIDAWLQAICDPVTIDGRDVGISVSAGVARFPEDGTSAVELAKNADLALYQSKAGGRNRSSLFIPAMREAFDARKSVLSNFRSGLRAGHVVPYYQPKVSLATGSLVGFEALARWIHPERGLLTPAVFTPVFEDGDLVRHLGVVMRAAVLSDMARWLGQGLAFGRMAVNCAGAEFADGDFGRTVLGEIEGAGVPPALFEIEVTEGVMLDRDEAPVGRAMATLRQAGVAISLDDFGTGYASLIHLKRFPVDTIKIDRSFVAGMADAADAAIVTAIIGVGRSLGIATVAEGIETADQAAKLFALGCDQAQGFFFGKPMPAERVPWFIKRTQARDNSSFDDTAGDSVWSAA